MSTIDYNSWIRYNNSCSFEQGNTAKAQAVGLHFLTKGGDAYAYYVAYRTFYRHNYRKTQQPPLA